MGGVGEIGYPVPGDAGVRLAGRQEPDGTARTVGKCGPRPVAGGAVDEEEIAAVGRGRDPIVAGERHGDAAVGGDVVEEDGVARAFDHGGGGVAAGGDAGRRRDVLGQDHELDQGVRTEETPRVAAGNPAEALAQLQPLGGEEEQRRAEGDGRDGDDDRDAARPSLLATVLLGHGRTAPTAVGYRSAGSWARSSCCSVASASS